MIRQNFILGLLMFLAAACTMTASPEQLIPVTPTETLATPSTALEWANENPHAAGICFEAAWDAAGKIFIIRSAEEHIRFYDLADNSGLCRRPVGREPRDFSTGYVIAGLWSKGMGCTARHEVTGYFRNDDSRIILMSLRFITEGECPYELVRPFWIGLENAANHEITLVIEP